MTINDRMNRIRERFLKKQRKEKLTNVSFTLTRTYVLVKLTCFFFFSPIFREMCLNVCYVRGKKKKKNIHFVPKLTFVSFFLLFFLGNFSLRDHTIILPYLGHRDALRVLTFEALNIVNTRDANASKNLPLPTHYLILNVISVVITMC